MTKDVNACQEYTVLPVRLHPNSVNCHEIFVKEHFIRVFDPYKPRGRTLFMLNIPPYITKHHLKRCFTKIGEVSCILFSEKPGKDDDGTSKLNTVDKFGYKITTFIFKVGYVIFKSTKSIQAALNMTAIALYDEKTLESYVKSGVEKWTQEYRDSLVLEHDLKNEIEIFMSQYDLKEERSIEAAKFTKSDNDGWITVGKDIGFEQKESFINKLEVKLEKSKNKKELKNFYTFQIRESKMQDIVSLRKKFEEDKSKIETLKRTKRFKPF